MLDIVAVNRCTRAVQFCGQECCAKFSGRHTMSNDHKGLIVCHRLAIPRQRGDSLAVRNLLALCVVSGRSAGIDRILQSVKDEEVAPVRYILILEYRLKGFVGIVVPVDHRTGRRLGR